MALPMAAPVTLQKLRCSGAEIAAPSRNVTRMLAEQSREVGGQKDGLAPHGERVEAVRRAALRQVREGKHRKEKAEEEGNEDAAAHAGIEQQAGCIRCAVTELIGGKL